MPERDHVPAHVDGMGARCFFDGRVLSHDMTGWLLKEEDRVQVATQHVEVGE